jgi:hypothetical protein
MRRMTSQTAPQLNLKSNDSSRSCLLEEASSSKQLNPIDQMEVNTHVNSNFSIVTWLARHAHEYTNLIQSMEVKPTYTASHLKDNSYSITSFFT